MKPSALAACLLLASALLAARAHACAGCRNPNMPVTRVDAVQLAPGAIRAGLSLGATSIRTRHQAGCADPAHCHEAQFQPLHDHVQRMFPGELRALGELGITESWGVEAQLPVRMINTSVDYETPEGEAYQPLDRGIHHRDETLFGIGDPWLLARWGGMVGNLTVTVRGGLALPLGRTEENPFALGDQGKEHQHVQFGTGTFDPVLAVDLSRPVGLWLLSAYAQGQAALYENRHGFRAGPRMSGGMQVGRKLLRPLTAALGAEVLHEGPESWDGETLQDGNLGRTEALAVLSLVHTFGANALGLSARVPVYRRIVEGDEAPGTLSSPLMLGLSLSRAFQAY